MDKKIIITIGRECGSGGKHIGQKLSEMLGIKCYDKELIAEASKESGLAEEIMASNDEVPTRSFLYSLVMDTYSMAYHSTGPVDMPIEQKVFLAQYNTIKKIAENESAIFVGRCADYALEERDDVLSVFITGDEDDKVALTKEYYSLPSDAKARDFMQKTDKKRSNYYNYYSNKRWGDASSYDICINSSVLGIDGSAELIAKMVELKLGK